MSSIQTRGKKRAASVDAEEMTGKVPRLTGTQQTTETRGKKRAASADAEDKTVKKARLTGTNQTAAANVKKLTAAKGKQPLQGATNERPANPEVTPYEQLKFDQKKPPKWGTQLKGASIEESTKDLTRAMGNKEAERVMALKEPVLVDGLTQKMYEGSYGQSEPGSGYCSPPPKRTTGRGKAKYEPLVLTKSWALFDPNRDLPDGWPKVPPILENFTHYTPGAKRILQSHLKSGVIATCCTPDMLKGKAVEYTPTGPKIVDAPAQEPDATTTTEKPTADVPAETTAPKKGRKGKRKATEAAPEPMPTIAEEPAETELAEQTIEQPGPGRKGKGKAKAIAPKPVPTITEEQSAEPDVEPSGQPKEQAKGFGAAKVPAMNGKRKTTEQPQDGDTEKMSTMSRKRQLPEESDDVLVVDGLTANKKRKTTQTAAKPAATFTRKPSVESEPVRKTTEQAIEDIATVDAPAGRKKRQPRPLPEKKEMPARAGRGQRKTPGPVVVKEETPAFQAPVAEKKKVPALCKNTTSRAQSKTPAPVAEKAVPVTRKANAGMGQQKKLSSASVKEETPTPESEPAVVQKKVSVMRKDSAMETAGGEIEEKKKKKKRTRKPSKPKITPAKVVEDSEEEE